MDTTPPPDRSTTPLSAAQIPEDEFRVMRRENLARWPTGAEVDIDEAVAFHKSMPPQKQLAWVMRQAVAQKKCLTQPRGGVATIEMQKDLMRVLDQDGLADILPTTTDSYTRNEQFSAAQKGLEESQKAGRSMLNGYPMVNYGVRRSRELIECIDKPAIILSGTAHPKLTAEIGLAAGFSGYLGSAIAYTVSYTKDLSIELGIRNYQYLDRLAALYAEKGVELHRRHPGFLTGTNIPPSIAIVTCILDALLAASQGVRHYGLELGQTLHMVQDAATIQVCQELCQEYLVAQGFNNVFTPVTSLHWMGAWPQDEAQCAALVCYGGTLAAVGGAANVTTKSTHEAIGIPTAKANAEGLRMTRMAVYLARHIRLDGFEEFEREKELIRREVRPIVDKTLEMGDGDAAVGAVRAFEAGVIDIPWSPNRHVKGKVMPARDADGYLRYFEKGDMPIPNDVMEFHTERLRRRAEQENVPLSLDLAVQSVFDIAEPLERLQPSPLVV